MSPRVSAIIPVHNGGRFIADAIDSVRAQNHPEIECIVVDDGSTDDTSKIAAGYPSVTLVQQARQGVSAARNAGAAAAGGELLAFLDADDRWRPSRVARQLAAMRAEGVELAMCAAAVIGAADPPRQTLRIRFDDDLLREMFLFGGTTTVSCSSAALVTREAFAELGGFDDELSMSADFDFFARFLARYERFAYIDEPLIEYRLHEGNMSRDILLLERDMRRVYKKLYADEILPHRVRDERRAAYAGLNRMLAASHFESRHPVAGTRALARAVASHPLRAVTGGRSRSAAGG